MNAEQLELVDTLCRNEADPGYQHKLASGQDRLTIHFSELPEDVSGGRIAREFNHYRREIGRLLAEGNEGKWLLIKGDEIVGVWDTEQDANQVRLRQFPMQDVLIRQILTWEPILRGPTFFQLCRS